MCITGLGVAQLSRQDMFKADKGVGVEMTDRVFRLAPCHRLPPGIGMLQNLPSAVVAHVLNPPAGAVVLDMCASPGGKSTHLAQLMSDQGTVIALDRSHAKAQQIRCSSFPLLVFTALCQSWALPWINHILGCLYGHCCLQ